MSLASAFCLPQRSFEMHAPFFYPKMIAGADSFCPTGAAGDLCFEQEGHERHDGIELNAEGKAASWLRLTARPSHGCSLQRYRHAGFRQQASD